jgi:hypothetical protein
MCVCIYVCIYIYIHIYIYIYIYIIVNTKPDFYKEYMNVLLACMYAYDVYT